MAGRKELHKIYRIVISILISLLVWSLLKIFGINLSIKDFLIIEISLGIGEFFSNFTKVSLGLKPTSNTPEEL